jgi:hypothetical protein
MTNNVVAVIFKTAYAFTPPDAPSPTSQSPSPPPRTPLPLSV